MQTFPLSLNLIIAGIAVSFILSSSVIAQERSNEEARISPNAAVSQTIGTTEVTITYGRPSIRDRVIFGERVPYDEVWRTGANEATTVTFSKDVNIEGRPLKAGTYGLFTIPRQNGNWTIIFNSVAVQWGAYKYNQDDDVLRLDVTSEKAAAREQMLIYFKDVIDNAGKAVIHWDEARVTFHIEEQ